MQKKKEDIYEEDNRLIKTDQLLKNKSFRWKDFVVKSKNRWVL